MLISDWSSDVCSSDLRIPANLRTKDWYSFSTRARVIVYNKNTVKAADVQNYQDLADPRLKGKVCVRSGAHPYNLSLGAAILEHQGEQKTEAWAKGLVANFARSPKGGDTDQIRAVAARSEEHTSELQSLMPTSYADFCLKKQKQKTNNNKL